MTTPRLQFRHAAAGYMGQVLTPEMCVALELAAFTPIDRAIPPERFALGHKGDYTIQLESFRAILPELHQLHVSHWQETEKYRHGLSLNPNYDAMGARELAGQLLQFTLRRGSELAGHLRMYLGQSLHTSTAMAEEDTLYLHPDHRPGTFCVIALLRYAEAALIELGVREIRANSKLVNNAGVLMRRLGYAEVATQFVKILKEEPHHVR